MTWKILQNWLLSENETYKIIYRMKNMAVSGVKLHFMRPVMSQNLDTEPSHLNNNKKKKEKKTKASIIKTINQRNVKFWSLHNANQNYKQCTQSTEVQSSVQGTKFEVMA